MCCSLLSWCYDNLGKELALLGVKITIGGPKHPSPATFSTGETSPSVVGRSAGRAKGQGFNPHVSWAPFLSSGALRRCGGWAVGPWYVCKRAAEPCEGEAGLSKRPPPLHAERKVSAPFFSPFFFFLCGWSPSQSVSQSASQQGGGSKMKKRGCSTHSSPVVSHPSTTRAWWGLTSVIGRERVFPPQYGRNQQLMVHLHPATAGTHLT